MRLMHDDLVDWLKEIACAGKWGAYSNDERLLAQDILDRMNIPYPRPENS